MRGIAELRPWSDAVIISKTRRRSAKKRMVWTVIQTILLQNKSGFTLIELLVSMVIMLVGLLGLLQTVNIAMEYNLKNQMRNEVVRIGDEIMNGMRTQPFDTVFQSTLQYPQGCGTLAGCM